MSRFFRAKKKFVSMAGGSGAGRKIIKSHLGEDGVVLLRAMKTVTLKLHGKKVSRSMKKSVMRFAVKGGYLFKEHKLTEKDAKQMFLPMEKLFKHGIDATQKDGDAADAADAAATASSSSSTTPSTTSPGETKTNVATTAHEDGDSDDDDDDGGEGGDDDDDDIPVVVTASASSGTGATPSAAVPAHLQPHLQGMSEQLIQITQVMQVLLKAHMSTSNIAKLSKTILFYSDLAWLGYFLTSEECAQERIETHRIFTLWYDTTFRPIVERRERREKMQRQYGQDMATFTSEHWLSNPKRQKYLAMYLKNIRNDKTTLQLYRAIHDFKATSSRNMVKVRGPMVYNKYLNVSKRKTLHFQVEDILVDGGGGGGGKGGGGGGNYIATLAHKIENKNCSKIMYDPVLTQLRQYISKDVMAPFKTSQEFSDYVRTTYYVNVDGTALEEEEEEEEEEGKKEEGKREGKREGKSHCPLRKK